MRGRVALTIIGLLGAAVVVWVLSLIGMPPLFVIAWLLLVGAVGIITRADESPEPDAWPPEKPQPDFRGSDVSRLAWSINTRNGAVGSMLVARLDALLRRRLQLRGLDIDEPGDAARIDALLGDGIRTALTAREVTRDDVERVLGAIETIPSHLEEK
ncbi:hypothetical protein [uncultured Microbacterium sp.]|uniref:hypothetical protein n=1 Tax=uncultured Microbacterium sp. TaxID=191216 RepID=UPI00261CB554|nr:hypothetical protein [uncultured Microbacterium sp.]